MGVQLQVFLTSALDTGQYQLHTFAVLPTGQEPLLPRHMRANGPQSLFGQDVSRNLFSLPAIGRQFLYHTAPITVQTPHYIL